MVKVEEAKKDYKEPSSDIMRDIDKSFYTKSMDLSDKDFDNILNNKVKITKDDSIKLCFGLNLNYHESLNLLLECMIHIFGNALIYFSYDEVETISLFGIDI